MRVFSELTETRVIDLLRHGAIGVIPTDTIYGLVCLASNYEAVERLYRTRPRDPAKACIILIASIDQITDQQYLTSKHQGLMAKYWPGPVSIILPASERTPRFVHRGENAVAYRMPANEALRELLSATGPLIAPSANPEGLEPAATLTEAQYYFGEHVDFYVDGGTMHSHIPSTLVGIKDNKIEVLRGSLPD
jgi:L-threonylcarbamoyladenylate synthase